MSHTQYTPARQRLQRSELAVPGSNPGMFEKAANSAVDYVFLDLEDAVAPGDKEQARKNIIEALHDIDWRCKGKTISVRINSLDTHYMYRDVVDLVEQAGDKIDTLLIPKAGVAADIYMVDAMLTQIETAKGFTNRIGIEALIEITLGMANVGEIARASSRMEALHFGVADYAASCRARTVNIGGLNFEAFTQALVEIGENLARVLLCIRFAENGHMIAARHHGDPKPILDQSQVLVVFAKQMGQKTIVVECQDQAVTSFVNLALSRVLLSVRAGNLALRGVQTISSR